MRSKVMFSPNREADQAQVIILENQMQDRGNFSMYSGGNAILMNQYVNDLN